MDSVYLSCDAVLTRLLYTTSPASISCILDMNRELLGASLTCSLFVQLIRK